MDELTVVPGFNSRHYGLQGLGNGVAMRGLLWVLLLVIGFACVSGASAGVAEAAVGDRDPAHNADFDGDGYDDLAIGGGTSRQFMGAVNVIYGSARGLTAKGDQLWKMDSPGIKGRPSDDGYGPFGKTLTTGDFDGDGYGDLVIGTPGHNYGAGAINVLYGSRKGLTATGDQFWTRASPGIKGAHSPDTFDNGTQDFGATLAAGDLDGDGCADLAVGVPGEGAGEVNVIYGSKRGLTADGDQLWSQDSPGIADVGEGPHSEDNEILDYGDRFGSALAIGQFGRSGHDDLVVGVPGENDDRGAVNVLYGSTRGLAAGGNQLWSQDSPGIAETGELGDGFGSVLTTADFGRSKFDDLAVGAPADGAVTLVYGSASGLNADGSQLWTRQTLGRTDNVVGFGSVMATGNFGRSRHSDLAVGSPADGVYVLSGSEQGLTSSGRQLWSLASPGIKGRWKLEYEFGTKLAAGDFGKSTVADLALAGPGDDLRGAVNVIYGTPNGLTARGDQVWSRNSRGIKGKSTGFGIALGSDTTSG